MKSKIILLFITLQLMNPDLTYCQQKQKTPYQKKITEISQKYFKIIYGYNKQLTAFEEMQVNLMTSSDDASNFILGIGMLNYATNHTQVEVQQLNNKIKSELKQAEKLKTDVDFKREKGIRDEKERKKRDLKAQEERNEKEQKLKEQQIAYENSDAGKIKSEIKTAFETWCLKGEFEKKKDYDERLKNKSSKMFCDICKIVTENKISSIVEDKINSTLSIYDSENELFVIDFDFNHIKWQNTIKVPIKEAEMLKTKWNNFSIKSDISNWCFIDNNLCPERIKIVKDDQTIFDLPLSNTNRTPISYSIKELNIVNQDLMDTIFNYVQKEVEPTTTSLNKNNFQTNILNDDNLPKDDGLETTVLQKVLTDERSEPPLEVVENMPVFPGGDAALSNFLKNNIKYPAKAFEYGIQGRVIIRFVVTKKGTVDKVEILRSLEPECDKEAIRLIMSLPSFIPGKQNGVNVPVWYTIPVTFSKELSK